MDESSVQISFVIPVYQGSRSVSSVVSAIRHSFTGQSFEVILVNDGSTDDSAAVCRRLVREYPGELVFVDLSRNFGEHSAVLAGLNHSRGQYVAVLDDDSQNPPHEILRMWDHLRANGYDVVYGRYRQKRHHWFRNVGSRFNDRMATLMLKKPAHIYLSSFKIMTRFLVRQVTRYQGPFPYIDGLIFRTTSSIGQIAVEHADRQVGVSGYSLRRLLRLWLNMFLGFSIAPLRISVVLGLGVSALSVLLMIGILIDKLWVNPDVPVGIPSILASITLFGGIQLMVLGTVGEYVGRIFLEQNGAPQYVVRELVRGVRTEEPARVASEVPQSSDIHHTNIHAVDVRTGVLLDV